MTYTRETSLTGGAIVSNCTLPSLTVSGTSFSTTSVHCYDLQVRKAENGFIVRYAGVDFVFETVDSLTKFITTKYPKKK